MRVCILTPEFLPSWGGIGTYTYYLARGLQGSSEVHVVTSDSVPEIDGIYGLDHVQVHRLPSARKCQPGTSNARFQLAVARHLPRIVREHGLELIHSNHAQMSDFVARLRPTGADQVLTVHTTLGTQLQGTLGGARFVGPQGSETAVLRHRRLLTLAERRYLRRTRSLIFVSRWVRDQALRAYALRPEHSRIVPNGVDTAMFAPARSGLLRGVPEDPWDPKIRPFTILFAGRLLAQKGLGTLLEAAQSLPPHIRILIAGPGDSRPWKALAARLGIAPSVCWFLGSVPYERMPALYHQADAFVLPSFAESCPMTALEAMASGTPLIASRVGGVPELVDDGETGWLFPAGDAQALANRIRAVMDGGAPVERVIRHARDWIESHATLARMSESTLFFYRMALEGANT